ncbi:hypothetical protein BKA56DRAFT_490115 [Neofusicoccum parvum]|uniref:Uncharacterized protein n=1 Tax=Neofusicoccum parvum TaxID=310453 RepID=A0ACB5SKK8_9PEZI|nr:hypothetical protein BKA56DRAFT_490115 [Neofusicoccum parvum]
MVKVAIAGATSAIAQDVIEGILAKNKHEPVAEPEANGVHWIQVDYHSNESLQEGLHGVEVVVCFYSGAEAVEAIEAQKRLIDACIAAGVKRYAPAEWASNCESSFSSYAFKKDVRKYLQEVNKERQVLEYTLFQPGLFLNYFAHPHQTTKHWSTTCMYIDLDNRRALCAGDGNYPITLTTVEDMAGVIAESLDYQGKWPVVGGMRGTHTTLAELIELAQAIRGPMKVETLSPQDLAAGELRASWYPIFEHRAITPSLQDQMSKNGTIEFLLSAADGSWAVSDEWNKLLPEYRFTTAEEYLRAVWEGKP